MRFRRRLVRFRPRDRVRSSDMWRELGGESLLLCIERSELRGFRHLTRMPLVSVVTLFIIIWDNDLLLLFPGGKGKAMCFRQEAPGLTLPAA